MTEVFSKSKIIEVYSALKNKKSAERNKKLPIGIDGVSSDVFERNLAFSVNEIYRKLLVANGKINYKFGPLLRIEKSKNQGGVRALHIPRLRDQIVFRLIHDEIAKLSLSKGIDLKIKSPYSFVNRFESCTIQNPSAVILKTDISQFYDTVPRDKAIELCKGIGMPDEIFDLLMRWSENLDIRPGNFYFNKDDLSNKTIGLPQGLSISSLLSELYVRQIDISFLNHKGYFRYIDDIVVVCENFAEAQNVLDQLIVSTTNIGLKLSPQKTIIKSLDEGIEWLGLIHFPMKRYIHPEKLNRAIRPVGLMQKACIQKIVNSQNEFEKVAIINSFIKQVSNHVVGRKNVRLKWYSLVEDDGQWKLMDKQIHGLIFACIRKAGLNKTYFENLPSIHSKVCSYKKNKESQNQSIKGIAPNV